MSDHEKPDEPGPQSRLARFWRFDVVFIATAAGLYLWCSLWALPDYGLTWDAAWENYYGDKSLNYYVGFDRDHLDMRLDTVGIHHAQDHPNFHDISNAFQDNDVITQPHLIWPLGPMAGSLTKYIFYGWLRVCGPITGHYVAPALAAGLLLVALYAFALRYLGRWQAVVAAGCLATYPRWWAHSHFNPKDGLSAVLFALVILSCYVAVRRRSWRWMAGSSVLWGLALAAKANALFLPFILGPWFLVEIQRRRRAGEDLLGRGTWIALGSYGVVGPLVMFLCWPLLWQEFPQNVGLYVSSLIERGGGEGGWDAMPLVNAVVTMPVVVLLLGLLGFVAIALAWRRKYEGLYLLILLWLAVPIGRVCLPGTRDFDVIRHWLEFVPALALLAGSGGGWALDQIAAKWSAAGKPAVWGMVLNTTLAVSVFLPTIHWLVSRHPNQLVYYSPLIGRLGGARERELPQATDYWGNVYLQGMAWMSANERAMEAPVLIVGVAEHIVFYTHQTQLDRRVELMSVNDVTTEWLKQTDRPVYLMYITRPAWYPDIVKELDGRLPPAHEVQVDGGVILRILRLR